MKNYQETFELLSREWKIVPYPLIWNKGNQGIASRPDFEPRHCYETAFFGYRGDATLIQTHSDIITASVIHEYHMSEKNEEMLKAFLRLVVDENTLLLDPTCGSGSALKAALALNAKYAVGLEINPEYAKEAMKNLANV